MDRCHGVEKTRSSRKDRTRSPKNMHTVLNCHRPYSDLEPNVGYAHSHYTGSAYPQMPPARWQIDRKGFRAVEIKF